MRLRPTGMKAISRAVLASVALTAALSLSLSACGQAGPSPAGGPKAVQVAKRQVDRVTLQTNLRRTRREARRLLGRQTLPPGSTRLARRPAGPSSSAIGTVAAEHQVDLVRYWRVPGSPRHLTRWLRRHRPSGVTYGGSAVSSSPRMIVRGLAWSAPDRSYGRDLAIEVSYRAGRHATLVRVDAVGVAVDPRPMRDSVSGRRVRVLVTGRCPRSDSGVVSVRNPGPGLRMHLLPRGRVVRALVCGYAGLETQHRWSLQRQHRLGSRAAARLAALERRLPVGHLDGAVMACPIDSGLASVLAFGYADGRTVDLFVIPGGCATTRNGHLVVDDAVPVR